MNFRMDRFGELLIVLHFDGSILDHSREVEVAKALSLAHAEGVQYLVVDILDVTFINAAGLSVLQAIKDRWTEAEGTLRVAGPCRRLPSQVAAFRLYAMFLCYPSVQEAIASLFLNDDHLPTAA